MAMLMGWFAPQRGEGHSSSQGELGNPNAPNGSLPKLGYPQDRPQYIIVLVIGTAQGIPNFGKPPNKDPVTVMR